MSHPTRNLLHMRWEDLLFLHWPIDPDVLRPHIPSQLEIDTFDGQAWIGVVPFLMAATRFRLLPAIPTAYRFLECNLRTYVRGARGRKGVWFFSLDAESRLAVAGARLGYGLPYFDAKMHCEHLGDRVQYRTHRTDRRGPPATFEAIWQSLGPARPAAPATLEHFLAERYCLYTQCRGKLLRGDIEHEPWQLAPAEVEIQQLDMTQLLAHSLAGPPTSALAAQPLTVTAKGLVRCQEKNYPLRDSSGAGG